MPFQSLDSAPFVTQRFSSCQAIVVGGGRANDKPSAGPFLPAAAAARALTTSARGAQNAFSSSFLSMLMTELGSAYESGSRWRVGLQVVAWWGSSSRCVVLC